MKDTAHRRAFDTVFALFFLAGAGRVAGEETSPATGDGDRPATPAGSGPQDGAAALVRELHEALLSGDAAALALLACRLVDALAGIEPGRPVGASYYVARVLRGLDLDGVLRKLLVAEPTDPAADVRLAQRFRREDLELAGEALRRAIAEEVARRLAAERGTAAVAATLRPALIEDVDFMHASREELAAMRRCLRPLARALAARLSRRRRRRRAGALDFRATIRRSLSTGGVPVLPRFRAPHRAKPELVVLADISGSVAAFARFTLHLVQALAGQFSAVRTFVFVDGIDEVTGIFSSSGSILEAISRVEQEAAVCAGDGHSDYGEVLARFCARDLGGLSERATVLVLGDGRGNYHPARPELLAAIARRVRHLYWLNPEPRAYWGSGDSVVGQYAPYCDAMRECRNLRQLEEFIAELA